ncbi:MAG: hypothetical protein ACYC6Y_16055 [Thermoguttaceae bacterium]
METWDIALLIAAAYVATFGLARLMTRRREQLVEQFRTQMEENRADAGGKGGKSPKAGKRQAA